MLLLIASKAGFDLTPWLNGAAIVAILFMAKWTVAGYRAGQRRKPDLSHHKLSPRALKGTLRQRPACPIDADATGHGNRDIRIHGIDTPDSEQKACRDITR